MNLKEVREQAREHLLQIGSCYEYISFRKDIGFYHTPSFFIKQKIGNISYLKCEHFKDEYAVFKLRKNGSLEPIMDTEHSKRFHNELIKRRTHRVLFDST